MSSSRPDSAWVWSQEHGDYYKAVYGPDGKVARYVWGRATIPPEPQQHRPSSNAPAYPSSPPQSSRTPATVPQGGQPYGVRPVGSGRTAVGSPAPPTSQPRSDQPTDQYGRIISTAPTHSEPQVDQYGRMIPTAPTQPDPPRDRYGRIIPTAPQYPNQGGHNPNQGGPYSDGYYDYGSRS